MAARYRMHAASPRTEQVRLRLTCDEVTLIREAAARASLTVSGYAAEASIAAARGLDAPLLAPWREALSDLMLLRNQLRRIGSNLNQAARALNSDGDAPVWLQRAVELVERRVTMIDDTAEMVRRLAVRRPPPLPSPPSEVGSVDAPPLVDQGSQAAMRMRRHTPAAARAEQQAPRTCAALTRPRTHAGEPRSVEHRPEIVRPDLQPRLDERRLGLSEHRSGERTRPRNCVGPSRDCRSLLVGSRGTVA